MNPKQRKWPITRHTRGMRALRWRSRMRMLMQWAPHQRAKRSWNLESCLLYLVYDRQTSGWAVWEARPAAFRAGKEWRLK